MPRPLAEEGERKGDGINYLAVPLCLRSVPSSRPRSPAGPKMERASESERDSFVRHCSMLSPFSSPYLFLPSSSLAVVTAIVHVSECSSENP